MFADSTRAKNAMDEKYGRKNYVAVHRASLDDLAETIACGGLANNKSKAIKKVIQHLVSKQMDEEGIKEEDIKEVSLDYLHDMTDLDAMKELVSFDGVGPKTASCVLLFCLCVLQPRPTKFSLYVRTCLRSADSACTCASCFAHSGRNSFAVDT